MYYFKIYNTKYAKYFNKKFLDIILDKKYKYFGYINLSVITFYNNKYKDIVIKGVKLSKKIIDDLDNKKYKKDFNYDYATYAYDKYYKQKGGTQLLNTRNKKCSSKNWTSCCPHMPPNKDGKYIATNEKTDLKYNNNIYVLHTCCLMCGQAMNELSNKNPNKFKKLYIHSIDKDGTILAKNQHTGVMVQKLKLK